MLYNTFQQDLTGSSHGKQKIEILYRLFKIWAGDYQSSYFSNEFSEKFNSYFPAGIYLLKVNNRNTRARFEICSKVIIKIPERRQWRCFGVFIVNFEYISHLALVFLLLTLNM